MAIYIAYKICHISVNTLIKEFGRPKSIFYRAIAEFEKEMHDNCRLAAIVREFEKEYKTMIEENLNAQPNNHIANVSKKV